MFSHYPGFQQARKQGLESIWRETFNLVASRPQFGKGESAVCFWLRWSRHALGLRRVWRGPLSSNRWVVWSIVLLPAVVSVPIVVSVLMAIHSGLTWLSGDLLAEGEGVLRLWSFTGLVLFAPGLTSNLMGGLVWLMDRILIWFTAKVLEVSSNSPELRGQGLWPWPRHWLDRELTGAASLWILAGALVLWFQTQGQEQAIATWHLPGRHLTMLEIKAGSADLLVRRSPHPGGDDIKLRGRGLTRGLFAESSETGQLAVDLHSLSRSKASPGKFEIEVPQSYTGDFRIESQSRVVLQDLMAGSIRVQAIGLSELDVIGVISHELAILHEGGPVRIESSQIDRTTVQGTSGDVQVSLRRLESGESSWEPGIQVASAVGKVSVALFPGYRGQVEIQSLHERVEAPAAADREVAGNLITTRWRTATVGQGRVDIRSISGSVRVSQ
jgi:hypothetical protein